MVDYKKTRKKEKTTDKVPGPSKSDNRQPTSNNQPEVSQTTDLAQPSTSASGDTSCSDTGAEQEERSQAREFQTANKRTHKGLCCPICRSKVDFSLDYIVKNKRVYKGFSHLFKHSLQ